MIAAMRRRTFLACITGAAVSSLFTGPATAQQLRYFRIATGSPVGTYFPVGAALASVISNPPGSPDCRTGGSCGVPGLIAVAISTEGSIANVSAVAAQLADSALAQADIVYAAVNGQGLFRQRPLRNLRVIANLYPESLHVVVRKSANITKMRDLIGRRVSLDTPGSGTRSNAELVLDIHGISQRQLKLLEVDPAAAADLMERGELDAFFLIAGYPAPIIEELARSNLIDLLPVRGTEADRVLKRHRFFARDTIPYGTYAGVGAVETLSIGAQWIVPAEADEQLIYQVTKALWHPRNRVLLNGGHPKARQIRLETSLAGVATPLHPGAERYYRDLGRVVETPPGQ
jgi:TRAP transporter TAXI family solute receptor